MPITDKFTRVSDGARAEPTTLAANRSVGATTITCTDLATWKDAFKVHFIIYRVDTNGKKIAGSQLDCIGIPTGNTLTNVQYKAGTDTGNASGAIVEAAPTTAYADELYEGLTAEHDVNGHHTAVTATTVSTSGRVTAGNGLTVSSGTVVLPNNTVNPLALQKPLVARFTRSVDNVHPAGSFYINGMDTTEYNLGGYTLFGGGIKVPQTGVYRVTGQFGVIDVPTGTGFFDLLIGWSVNSTGGPSSYSRFTCHNGVSVSKAVTMTRTFNLTTNDVVYFYEYAFGSNTGNYRLLGAGISGTENGSWLEIQYLGTNS
jgi:hypothetical protein